MSNEYDWLNKEQSSLTAEQQEQRNKAIEFARNYTIFTTDPRGKAIFEQWEEMIFRKVTPVNASIQEYAADNAQREFIQKIKQQVQLAEETIVKVTNKE